MTAPVRGGVIFIVGLAIFLLGLIAWGAGSNAATVTDVIGGIVMGWGSVTLWPSLGERLRGR